MSRESRWRARQIKEARRRAKREKERLRVEAALVGAASARPEPTTRLEFARAILTDAAFAFVATLAITLIVASLAAAGLITMGLALLLLGLAWIVAMFGTLFLPLLPKHRAIFGGILGMMLLSVGIYEASHFEKPPTAKEIAEELRKAVSRFANHSSDEKLPGFASGMMVQITDVTEERKKYQFSFRTPEGSKVAFYLSPSNRYAFSVTDIKGEEYKLDIPLGANGIPFEKWAYIFCEVGTASSYSYLRAVLNGKEVARRDFDFPLDLGSRRWMPTLGADASGQNGGAFMMTEMGAFSTTLSDKELIALAENALSAYGLKP